MKRYLSLLLAAVMLLSLVPVVSMPAAAADIPVSINEDMEAMEVGTALAAPFQNVLQASVVQDASTNKTKVVHLYDSSATSAAQVRAQVQDATALDIEFDVKGVSGGIQMYITAGGRSTANTAYFLQLSGKTVQYYDGSAWKTLKTRAEYITSWTTVRIVANLESAEIYVNGELMGVAPRTGGSYGTAVKGILNSITFCCGSAASASKNNFYLDNVKMAAVPATVEESFENANLDVSFGEMFLNSDMASVVDLEGNKVACLEDTSTTAPASLRAVMSPSATMAVEFDVMDVSGAVQLYITDGVRNTANTAYWLQIYNKLVRYYSGSAWVTIHTMDANLPADAWTTIRVEADMTTAKIYINGVYVGEAQRAGGSYGSAVTDTVNSISFIAGGNADANVKYYVDNVEMSSVINVGPTELTSFSQDFETLALGSTFPAPFTDPNMATIAAKANTATGSQNAIFLEDTSTTATAGIRASIAKVSAMEVEFNYLGWSGALQLHITSGSRNTANTAYWLQFNGKYVQYYDGAAWKTIKTRDVFFTTWTNIRVEADMESAKIYVNDELMGTALRASGSYGTNVADTIDSVSFVIGAAAGTGNKCYVDDVAMAPYTHTHSYDEGVVTVQPGCETEGVKTFTCSCGDSYTEPVAATGHSYDEGVVTVQPGCETEGVKTFTCSCGDSYTEPVAATGHSFSKEVTAPTCEDKGYTTYTCACGHSYVADEVAALGHSYDEGIITVQPGCETEGVKTYTCSCGHSYTEPVAATGHSYDEGVYTDPTFDADGYTTYTCSCGHSYTVVAEGTQKIAVASVNGERFESLEAAIAAANGNAVVLEANIELAAPIVIAADKNVTIDLNGKSLVYNSTTINEAMISNLGVLTINDSVGTGEIFYNYTGANDPAYFKGNYTISNGGTLTVNGGKIHIANLRSHAKYPINNNSGNGDAILVINGGHLYNYNTAAIRQFCNSTVYANSVTINGGLIEGYSAIWVQNPGKYTVNGQLTITGGEIKTTAAAYVNGTSELKDVSSKIYFSTEGGAWDAASFVSITGGILNENIYLAEGAPASINVEGEATFNGRVELPVVPTGIEIVTMPTRTIYMEGTDLDLSDGVLQLNYNNGTFEQIALADAEITGYDKTAVGIQTLTVTYSGFTTTFEVEVIAGEGTVNGIGYKSLAEAIMAAQMEGAPVVVSRTIEMYMDGTLDLQGVTFQAADSLVNAPVFRILADVTVQNGIVDGSTGINSYAFIVGNSEIAGTLTITDGNYYGITSVVSITNGTCNISGGTFQTKHDNEGTDYGAQYLLNCMDAAYKNGTAVYNITGGIFVGFNPENNAAEGAGTNFLPDGMVSVDNGDGTFSVIEKYLTSIAVIAPSKLSYVEGQEALDLTGGKLVLVYSNGTTEEIDLAAAEVSGFDNTVLGAQTLTVSYEGFTATFDVEVTAYVAPEITWISGNAVAVENKTTVFAVSAKNVAAYQWQISYNGNDWSNFDIEAATTYRISFKATKEYDNAYFRCVVSDAFGNEYYSAAMLLDVQVSELGIGQQTSDQNVALNDTVTFKAEMSGGVGNVKYQWYYLKPGAKNWVITTLDGYNTDTLTIKAYSSRDGYQFKCVIKDSSGAVVESEPATLTIKAKAAEFSVQPQDVTVEMGKKATFTAAVINTVEPVKYHWYFSDDNGQTWGSTGNKTDTLTIAATGGRDGYLFRCVVSDGTGHVIISDNAALTVIR